MAAEGEAAELLADVAMATGDAGRAPDLASASPRDTHAARPRRRRRKPQAHHREGADWGKEGEGWPRGHPIVPFHAAVTTGGCRRTSTRGHTGRGGGGGSRWAGARSGRDG